MPFFTSKQILAKDIIGQGLEIAAIENARIASPVMGRMFYNMAVAELHMFFSFIDQEALLKSAAIDVTSPTGHYKAAPIYASGTEEDLIDYDKIKAVEITNDTATDLVYLQSFPMLLEEFLQHKSEVSSGEPSGASSPYSDAVIYTIVDTNLFVLWGKNITIDTPTCTVYFTRQPVILTSSNYDAAYMDAPDKYSTLLTNRIASYAELRQGITDRSLVMAKNSYEQLLVPLDNQIKEKIVNSIQFKSMFTATEK